MKIQFKKNYPDCSSPCSYHFNSCLPYATKHSKNCLYSLSSFLLSSFSSQTFVLTSTMKTVLTSCLLPPFYQIQWSVLRPYLNLSAIIGTGDHSFLCEIVSTPSSYSHIFILYKRPFLLFHMFIFSFSS